MTSERQQPDAASSNTEIDHANVEKPLDTPEQENEAAQPSDAENVPEQPTEGAPLDQAPSQAAKMSKNKIIVVMTALCVRKLSDARGAGREVQKANLMSHCSWRYSWRLWIWYVYVHPLDSAFINISLADYYFHRPPHYCRPVWCLRERFLMDRIVISSGECRLYPTVGQDQ